MYYVYTYSVPGEELPFYVGKGTARRIYRHLDPSTRLNRRTHFYNKLNSLLNQGISPIIKIVASELTEQQAFDLEISLIQIYGRKDIASGCLCNHTSGGDGPTGHTQTSKSIWNRALAQSKQRTIVARRTLRDSSRKLRGKAIESFDLRTGQMIKQYKCLSDVKSDGFNRNSVSNVLSGKTKSSGYLGWRYSNEQ